MISSFKNKYPWLFSVEFGLAAVVFAAFLLRLAYAEINPMLTRDGIGYLEFCRNWRLAGDAALPFEMQGKPLLFQYLICVLMQYGLTAETAAQWINLIAGTLLVIPVYLAANVLFGRKPEAFCAAIFAAVMPPMVKYSVECLREGLYLFFSAWCLFALFQVLKKKGGPWSFVCGIFVLLAMMCRFEALELVVICGIAIPVGVFFPEKKWQCAGTATLLFAAGIATACMLFLLLPGMPSPCEIYLNRLRLI